MKTVKVVVKVANAKIEDVGKEAVRLDSATRRLLNLNIGDIVKITGKKTTAAIVWRAYPEDENLGLIRMDGITRRNADVSLGERVYVEKAYPGKAEKIILAPVQSKLPGNITKYIKKKLIGVPLVVGDLKPVNFYHHSLNLKVVNTKPKGIVVVEANTAIVLREKSVSTTGNIPYVTYEDIGGLKEEIQRIREMVELPLKYPELFQKLGIEPPSGVLLYGPPGCGKTLLAKAVANETEANFIAINGPEIMNKFYGESERRLRKIFNEAKNKSPSIIFIDEIDAIAPKREEVTGEVERRVVAQLLALMDGLSTRGKVIVIAATNRPNALEPALRRPGRLDREIEIKVPDKKERLEILKIHTRNMPLAEDVNLEEIAEVTHGFVGADLSALAKEAAIIALRRYIPTIDSEKGKFSPEIFDEIKIKACDFQKALKRVQPSALREIILEKADVKWGDIGGLHEAKSSLREAVEWPLKHREVIEEMGIEPPSGVLLYGPPGCGKTLLAKAVANETEANFIAINGPEIISMWMGETERAVREIFRKAKLAAPSIVFFDEVDAIAPKRSGSLNNAMERAVSQLLTEIDGVKELKNVTVIAATNRPDLVDPALFRPGRLEKLIYVGEPDFYSRVEIFKIYTRKMKLKNDVDLEKLAEKTQGYSGADIKSICREAGFIALRKNKMQPVKVRMQDFEEALLLVSPSISPELTSWYKSFEKNFRKPSLKKFSLETM